MKEKENTTVEETTTEPISADIEKAEEETDPVQNNPPPDTQDAQGGLTSDFLKNPDIIAYIEKQVAEGIKKALKGTPPKANTADITEHDKKNFDRMTYKERLNLFKTNPQTYYKLSKGAK